MEGEGIKQKDSEIIKASEKEEIQLRKTKSEDIFEIIQRYDYYIGQANSKASFLIGIIGLALFALMTNKLYLIDITELSKCYWLNNIIFILAGGGLFIALILAMRVLFPIVFSGNETGSYTSFVAYSSVAKMKYEVFREHHASNDYDFWEDLIRQAYILATITDKKFILIKWAVRSTIFSIIMFILLFAMMSIKG